MERRSYHPALDALTQRNKTKWNNCYSAVFAQAATNKIVVAYSHRDTPTCMLRSSVDKLQHGHGYQLSLVWNEKVYKEHIDNLFGSKNSYTISNALNTPSQPSANTCTLSTPWQRVLEIPTIDQTVWSDYLSTRFSCKMWSGIALYLRSARLRWVDHDHSSFPAHQIERMDIQISIVVLAICCEARCFLT